jgi:acyl carrier protein
MSDAIQDSGLEAKVFAIIREAVELPPNVPITLDTNFITDLDVDSLTLIRIDSLLQAKIGLALAADDIEDVETVGDLLEALTHKGQATTMG